MVPLDFGSFFDDTWTSSAIQASVVLDGGAHQVVVSFKGSAAVQALSGHYELWCDASWADDKESIGGGIVIAEGTQVVAIGWCAVRGCDQARAESVVDALALQCLPNATSFRINSDTDIPPGRRYTSRRVLSHSVHRLNILADLLATAARICFDDGIPFDADTLWRCWAFKRPEERALLMFGPASDLLPARAPRWVIRPNDYGAYIPSGNSHHDLFQEVSLLRQVGVWHLPADEGSVTVNAVLCCSPSAPNAWSIQSAFVEREDYRTVYVVGLGGDGQLVSFCCLRFDDGGGLNDKPALQSVLQSVLDDICSATFPGAPRPTSRPMSPELESFLVYRRSRTAFFESEEQPGDRGALENDALPLDAAEPDGVVMAALRDRLDEVRDARKHCDGKGSVNRKRTLDSQIAAMRAALKFLMNPEHAPSTSNITADRSSRQTHDAYDAAVSRGSNELKRCLGHLARLGCDDRGAEHDASWVQERRARNQLKNGLQLFLGNGTTSLRHMHAAAYVRVASGLDTDEAAAATLRGDAERRLVALTEENRRRLASRFIDLHALMDADDPEHALLGEQTT